MSHDDVRALVAYAKQYHIDVVPEQEAFGHLHHVLKYDHLFIDRRGGSRTRARAGAIRRRCR